jgi:hypothetical protein
VAYRDDLAAALERIRHLEAELERVKGRVPMIEAISCPRCGQSLILSYTALSQPKVLEAPEGYEPMVTRE